MLSILAGGSGYGAVTTGGQAHSAQGGGQQVPASAPQVRYWEGCRPLWCSPMLTAARIRQV